MKRFKIPIVTLVLFVLAIQAPVLAQTYECGGLLGAEFDFKIVNKLHLSVESEGRFNQNFTNFDRFKLGAGLDYSFWKKRFKIAAGADYLVSNQQDYYENRGRVQGSLSYTAKIQQFELSYRVRVQSTFYDESHKDHKFNPKTYLRNRLQVEYNFFEKPLKLYASTEFFLRLYQNDNYIIDEFRTQLGMNYKFNAHNSLGVFLRADTPIQVKNPDYAFYLGIVYGFKR